MMHKEQLTKKVAEVYNWLDMQNKNNTSETEQCNACGACCNFAEFDHRLFVTTPELIYLNAKIGAELKPMRTSVCPYNINGKCSIHENRFAGCRIFFCKGNAEFQSKLSETVVKKFKAICTELQIPYRYVELSAALNERPSNIYRSDAEHPPAAHAD
ncbi:hypothetical protein ACFL1G_10495 [Planctomycetota bacterium]